MITAKETERAFRLLATVMNQKEICSYCSQDIFGKEGKTCPNCGASRLEESDEND